jgi:hypothetical protein
MNGTEQHSKVKVAPARNLISRPRDLVDAYEQKHVALLALSFGERTFEGETKPTPVVEVMVVDLETAPVRTIASLTISWRRVVPALRLGESDTWQVGRLKREGNAVMFLPPDPTFDLERAASELGGLELQGGGRPPASPIEGTTRTETKPQHGVAARESAAGDSPV